MKTFDKEIKFVVGTKVIVCDDLQTTIEKVEWVELFEEYRYWFKDIDGKLWNETEIAIKKIMK